MEKEIYFVFQQAKNLINEGKYEDAMTLLRKINALDPRNIYVKFELAKLLIRNKTTRGEGKKLLKELFDTPNKAYAMYELGKAERIEGNRGLARVYLEQLKGTCVEASAMLELGKLEENQGNYYEAETYFLNLLSSKYSHFALIELGILKSKVGDYVEAKEYFDTLSGTTSEPIAKLELGRICVSEGNLEEAKDIFEKLLTTTNKLYAILELGKVEMALGNYDKARQLFNSLLTCKNRNGAQCQLLYLDVLEEKFMDAKNRIDNVDINIPPAVRSSIKFYIECKLGLINPNEIVKLNYLKSQLVKYDRNLALNCIKFGKDQNGNIINHKSFDIETDYESLMSKVEEKVVNERPIKIRLLKEFLIYMDEHYTTKSGDQTKYLDVTTLPNGKDVMAIYPVKVNEKVKSKTY